MRSLPILEFGLKFVLAALAAGLLAGCLVSETPVLDASNGRAAPLAEGKYRACENDDEAGDCNVFNITRSDDGAYTLASENEEPSTLRFRRIARGAYAVQTSENDGYGYYYGAGDAKAFSLTLMLCPDLPEQLRAKLIAKGDLSTDSTDFETCTVNTVKGLVAAAKAYHRGQTTGEEDAKIVLKPIAAEQTGD